MAEKRCETGYREISDQSFTEPLRISQTEPDRANLFRYSVLIGKRFTYAELSGKR